MTTLSNEMKTAWNTRANKDAYHYVETRFWNHDQKAFFALGEARAQELIDPVLRRLRIKTTAKTAVDLGCGVGRFTHALGRRFDQVVGIDVSDSMVTQAKAAAQTFSNLKFVVSDGMSLPQPDQSADFVWSYEVFQHMPSREVIAANLREVARVLTRDGYGLIHLRTGFEYSVIIWHVLHWMPTSFIRFVKRLLRKDTLTADQYFRGAKPLTWAATQDLCRQCGLQIVEARDDPTHDPGMRQFVVVQACQ